MFFQQIQTKQFQFSICTILSPFKKMLKGFYLQIHRAKNHRHLVSCIQIYFTTSSHLLHYKIKNIYLLQLITISKLIFFSHCLAGQSRTNCQRMVKAGRDLWRSSGLMLCSSRGFVYIIIYTSTV